jgi:hypothetical protein
MQARPFRGLVRLLFSRVITDPVCRVCACRRQVLQEIVAYNVSSISRRCSRPSVASRSPRSR